MRSGLLFILSYRRGPFTLLIARRASPTPAEHSRTHDVYFMLVDYSINCLSADALLTSAPGPAGSITPSNVQLDAGALAAVNTVGESADDDEEDDDDEELSMDALGGSHDEDEDEEEKIIKELRSTPKGRPRPRKSCRGRTCKKRTKRVSRVGVAHPKDPPAQKAPRKGAVIEYENGKLKKHKCRGRRCRRGRRGRRHHHSTVVPCSKKCPRKINFLRKQVLVGAPT